VDWLLESTVDGSTWLRRFSSFEADHNRQAHVRNGWLKAFQDLGFAPQFISSKEIETGRLKPLTDAVLVLPSSHALSDREAAEITAFMEHDNKKVINRAVFCDGVPGAFDEHGKLRKQGVLERFFPASAAPASTFAAHDGEPSTTGPGDIAVYASDRLTSGASEWPDWLKSQLGRLRPEIIVAAGARVRIHRFRAGGAELIAFERNVDYQMSEDLKQAGGNEALEKPIELEATLSYSGHLFDLRAQKYLGLTNHLRFTLDPWQPSLFAVTREKLSADSIVATLAREEDRGK
jgi:hypothetical protein